MKSVLLICGSIYTDPLILSELWMMSLLSQTTLSSKSYFKHRTIWTLWIQYLVSRGQLSIFFIIYYYVFIVAAITILSFLFLWTKKLLYYFKHFCSRWRYIKFSIFVLTTFYHWSSFFFASPSVHAHLWTTYWYTETIEHRFLNMSASNFGYTSTKTRLLLVNAGVGRGKRISKEIKKQLVPRRKEVDRQKLE